MQLNHNCITLSKIIQQQIISIKFTSNVITVYLLFRNSHSHFHFPPHFSQRRVDYGGIHSISVWSSFRVNLILWRTRNWTLLQGSSFCNIVRSMNWQSSLVTPWYRPSTLRSITMCSRSADGFKVTCGYDLWNLYCNRFCQFFSVLFVFRNMRRSTSKRSRRSCWMILPRSGRPSLNTCNG